MCLRKECRRSRHRTDREYIGLCGLAMFEIAVILMFLTSGSTVLFDVSEILPLSLSVSTWPIQTENIKSLINISMEKLFLLLYPLHFVKLCVIKEVLSYQKTFFVMPPVFDRTCSFV